MNDLDNNVKGKASMTFIAFEDCQFTKPLNREYKAMINPDSFDRSFSFLYSEDKTTKRTPVTGKFAATNAETYNFSLLLDGTGRIDPDRCDVNQDLEKLFSVLFTKTEEGYYPNFIQMFYCHQDFYCTVNSIKVNYTLFNRDGSPLRAKVTCSFSSAGEKPPQENEEEKKKKKKKEKKKPQPSNCCCCICPPNNQSYEATYSEAISSNSNSLMCSEQNRI